MARKVMRKASGPSGPAAGPLENLPRDAEAWVKALTPLIAEGLDRLKSDQKAVETFAATIPADADRRAFAQRLTAEFVFNFIEGHARDVLAGEAKIPIEQRRLFEEQLKIFRSSADGFTAALGDPEHLWELVHKLALAASVLGLALQYSESALAQFEKLRMKTLQSARMTKIELNDAKLETVIREVCDERHRKMSASIECARQIRPFVQAKLKAMGSYPSEEKIKDTISAIKNRGSFDEKAPISG